MHRCLPLLARVFDRCLNRICAGFPRMPGTFRKKSPQNPNKPANPPYLPVLSASAPAGPSSPRLRALPSLPCAGPDRARLRAGGGPRTGAAAGRCPGRKSRRRQHLRLRLSSPALHRREGGIYPAERPPLRGKAGGAPGTPDRPETPPGSSGLVPSPPQASPPRERPGPPGERSPKRAGTGPPPPRRVCLLIPGVIPQSGIIAGGR